jgi:hypothetical protein
MPKPPLAGGPKGGAKAGTPGAATPGSPASSGSTGPSVSDPSLMKWWVGYNPMTQRFSVSFDGFIQSGMGTLIQTGYTVMIQGPTTWDACAEFMKSVGAPGW